MAEPRPGRWRAIAILMLARMSMAFQFQSIAAVSSVLTGAGMSYAFYGWLLGLYLLPGIVVALPGGWLAGRFGDIRVLIWGLVLMIAGGVWIALADAPSAMLAARVLAGIGGVFLNVLVTKVASDWMQGGDDVLGFAIVVTSWPAGLALAMFAIAPLASVASLTVVHLTAVAPAALALAALLFAYPTPPASSAKPGESRLLRHEVWLALTAGGVWALFNVSLIVLLGFGPEAFVAKGAGAVEAARAFSWASWMVALASIRGATLAGMLKRRWALLVTGLLYGAVLIAGIALTGPSVLGITLAVMAGFGFALTAPLVMGLPAGVIPIERRAMGYGLFFTVYFIAMAFLPPLVGRLRDLSGNGDLPLWASSTMLVGAMVVFGVFARSARTLATQR